MLLLAQAPQDEILAAFAPLPVPADPAQMWAVGPTAASGWTAAWVKAEPVLPERWTLVLLGEVGDPRVVRVRRDGAERRFAWGSDAQRIPAEVPAAIAGTLGLPAIEDRVREVLTEHLLQGAATELDARDALAEVAVALNGAAEGLPLLENTTDREILLDRGDAERRRRLAEKFARNDTGWVLTELGGDWFSVHSALDPERSPEPYSLGGGFGEGSPVLSLWRGSASGALLQDSEDLLELLQWNTGWVDQIEDPEERAERVAIGEQLAAAFGPVAGQRRLRELCAAQTVDGDPLAQLLELLNIPRTALLVLDGDPSAPAPMVADTSSGLVKGLKRLFGGRR